MDNNEEESKVQNRKESDVLDLNNEEIKPVFEENEQIDSPLQIYSENIKISVCNPIIKEGLSKHVVYTVKGNDPEIGAYEFIRRFSDFDHLREFLMNRWPGCFIPSIPPKKTMGNLEPKFIEERRQGLDDFCRNIANIKHIYNSEEFKMFMSSNIPDMEKALKNLPQQSNEDLIEKYKKLFELHSEIKCESLELVIDEFEAFIKKVKVMYNNFSEMARNASSSRKKFNENFFVLLNYMLPEYEKNCLIEYVDYNESKFIFNNKNNANIGNSLKSAKNSFDTNAFYKLFLKLSREQRDMDGLQDAINIKKKYLIIRDKIKTKLLEHKQELQKLQLKGKNEKEKIEKLIANEEKELQTISSLCEFIVNILFQEINRLKNDKMKEYYNILKLFTKSEVEYAKSMEELWRDVANNLNLSDFE